MVAMPTSTADCQPYQLAFDTASAQCISPSACFVGAPGCDCTAVAPGSNYTGNCASGFECNPSLNQCVVRTCPPGNLGCPCTDQNTCNAADSNVKCQAIDVANTKKICVAVVQCQVNQIARCIAYCGQNNIKRCPPCDYQVPECFSKDSASGVTVSITLLILSIISALLL